MFSGNNGFFSSQQQNGGYSSSQTPNNGYTTTTSYQQGPSTSTVYTNQGGGFPSGSSQKVTYSNQRMFGTGYSSHTYDDGDCCSSLRLR